MVDPVHSTVSPSSGEAPSGALTGACSFANLTLPNPLPNEPLALFAEWLNLAHTLKTQPNPNALTLATIDPDGSPAARIVLARRVDQQAGTLTFFTNYNSRKGLALTPVSANGEPAMSRVACVFHWDHLDRQVRFEGCVVKATAAESDAYFHSRPILSQVAAWASDQSQPIVSREELLRRNDAVEARFGITRKPAHDGTSAPPEPTTSREATHAADATAIVPKGLIVPRPPHWGGFRVWIDRAELWLGHSARLHDRGLWQRTITFARGTTSESSGATPSVSAWSVGRLQP